MCPPLWCLWFLSLLYSTTITIPCLTCFTVPAPQLHTLYLPFSSSLFIFRINDNESCADLLLEKYSEELLNLCDEANRSAIHAAAFNNHVECLQLLLRYNAKVNQVDQMGRTPLMMAANYGHSAAVGKGFGLVVDLT